MAPPNESTHFAFQELVLLARIDRRVQGSEARVLARFARHLQIPERKARQYLRVSRRRAADFPQDEQRQLDLLRMLARVAYSDGVLQPQERQFFDRLADDFGIPRTRIANVLEEAEHRAHRHSHLDRRWLCAVLLGLVLVTTIGWIWASSRPDEMVGFKALDDALRPSLLLVHTRYVLEHPTADAKQLSATGTGFFVSADGLAVTNKHVLQPWRFQGRAVELLANGYDLDADSVRTWAWREGETVLRGDRSPSPATAFRRGDGTLEVVALAPDAELAVARRPVALRKTGLFVHANDNGDLAILRCKVRTPVAAVTLADASDSVRRLDPIMVLGYPRGLHLLESTRAVSSPSVGRVRKIEQTIYVTAPVVGGNSGGPLVNADGRIVGVATRTSGASTLACCLRIEHARALLRRIR